jgi:hypothetical protein
MAPNAALFIPSPGWSCSGTTTKSAPLRRERPGGNPAFQNIGAISAESNLLRCSLAGPWTDSKPVSLVCALDSRLRSIASAPVAGVGDGFQPQHDLPHAERWRAQSRRGCCSLLAVGMSRAMSHAAIAAALALDDVSCGERLTAFSLASFANREHRAWPGTPVAAGRAGLSRSQYLAARDALQHSGLIRVEESSGGRGRSPLIEVGFAKSGPWFDGEINAPLFEAVLGYSHTRGSARLLLAALAAVANQQLEVVGLATDEIRAAAGMADSTYRRARAALLSSGEIVLDTAGGGRAKTNRWVVSDPGALSPKPVTAASRRVAPRRNARPLIAAARPPAPAADDGTDAREVAAGGEAQTGKGPGLSGVSELNPGQNRTVSGAKGPGSSGVSELNPGQDRTVSRATPPEAPSQTPPETPPPNARAGREPQNHRTCPPSPPDGGSRAGLVTIVEDYITDRGRKRQRTVTVELDAIGEQLLQPAESDLAHWQQISAELRRVVDESTFEIWLAQLQLCAVDATGTLLLDNPPTTRLWVAQRYGSLLDRSARTVGRDLRFVNDRERQILEALADQPPYLPYANQLSHDKKEAV